MRREEAPPGRYGDPFVRETARRIYFLMAAAGRYGEPARLIEELRRALAARGGKAAGG
jgi:hypothetical protein